MNPSASGWMAKLLSLFTGLDTVKSDLAVYNELRTFGFIYGINVKLNETIEAYHKYSEDELTKINLVFALLSTFHSKQNNKNISDFVLSVLDFYKTYHVSRTTQKKKSLSSNVARTIQKLRSKKEDYQTLLKKERLTMLENIINDRIYSNDYIIIKNHLQTINKALMYIDILCYDLKQSGANDVDAFAALMENLCFSVIYQSYKAKKKLTGFDLEIKQLLKKAKVIESVSNPLLFESITANLPINKKSQIYLFDLACRFSIYNHRFDTNSLNFLQDLAKILNISESSMKASLDFAVRFSMTYQRDIEQIENVNLISNIYDGSSQMVSKLIRRNSKRLIREIKQSKELMSLLTKSTYTDLTKEEQRELQFQLVDILKTIPSLAIFLLPGGAILLPLFAKLIPNIIPSAFDDNRIDES